jgi:uncharacterized protein (DUF983 family)
MASSFPRQSERPAQTITVPCPECGKREGYTEAGPYRTVCDACGALLKHAEVKPKGAA